MSEHKYTAGDTESSERKVRGTLLQCRQIRVREAKTGFGWFILLTRANDCWIDWRVVTVCSVATDAGDDAPEFELRCDAPVCQYTSDPWLATAIATGMVKWDGCCDTSIEEHVCSPRDLRDLLRVVAMAYHEAAKWLGDKFDCPEDMADLAKMANWGAES